MTTAVKPIIKLPPRSNRSNSISVKPVEISIYFEDQENKLSDVDIQNLLQDFAPVQIKRERGGGYLSFQDTKIAEKVYSFYNGYVFTNNVIFKLSLNDSQQPEGPLLEIRNLPQSIDHHQLFELCRPFGSLHICKVIKEEGNIKKRALVQYFRKQDSDSSQINLNNKAIEGSTIQVAILMPSNLTNHRYSVSQEKNESSGYIDYMNLYVKNLDPTIGNTELFSLFRKFGHIVSARVMSNPATGLSKGYGFVSYSKPEEAALALNEMNGMMVRSKAMVVAYHEPKKPRQEKSSSTTTSSFHSPPSTAPPVEYGTVPYFETRHPHEAILGPGIEPVDSLNLKELSLNPTVPMQRKLSFADLPYRTPHFTQRPSLASILPSHLERVPEEDHRRRKGSVESVMTESSAHLQKIKMTEAVKRCGSFGPELKHIVDMLLTLKKRERSLCLFNSDFLKEKINAAIEALEVFDEDEEEEEVIVRKPSIRNIPEHIIPPPRISKAIPIVAPPSPEETAKMAEIKKLLSSFEGKPIHERKQLLGDQLFPLVKATGVRHAPKITIRLLDTIELEELAKIMFNKELLKVQVNKVA